MTAQTKSRLLLIAVTGLQLLFINADDLTPEERGFKGALPPTAEHIRESEKRKIKEVRLNRLGLERVNQERKNRHMPDLPSSVLNQKEILLESESASAVSDGATGGTASAIPAQVDNSQLASFPSIGNQGAESSCVTWASTYYMMSHEVCLALGCDNKVAKAHVFSPRWTYNMINSGNDSGSYTSDAFSLLASQGAAQLSELPYVAGQYRFWDLNSDHWKNAINFRTKSYSSLSLNSDTAMASAKNLLINGHLIYFTTYINSWQIATVQADPAQLSNPFVGQAIARYVNGSAGSHAMTIVGYDDSIWTDINGNGIVDAGEKGAFKIANSWGSSWRNAGFIWVAYDAFRSVSAVPNFAPAGRAQIDQGYGGMTTTYQPYAPKLLGKVRISHLLRNQMSFRFGSSSTSSNTAQSSWSPFALVNKGGPYSFNGTTTEVEGTFYFDISSLYTASSVDQQRFYLTATDNVTGSPLTVSGFEIVDPVVGNTLAAASNVPLVADASSQSLSIGTFAGDSIAPSVPLNLTGSVVSQKNGKRNTTTSVALKWSASTDNVAVAKYAVYRNGVKIGESTSLSYSDSSGSAGVTYNYQVSAIDSSGNESAKSNIVAMAR
jgi:C1A family cysteine protease